jgi:hemerythrin superfamily protein
MIPSTPIARRTLFAGAGAAAAAALLPMQHAVAQTAAAKGDWMAMVKAQHMLVAQTFDELIASARRTYGTRNRIIDRLGYQLTAHSVAEENVLYPALATAGMVTESDKLYLDQAHAKVMNTQLEMLAKTSNSPDPAWLEKARALQTAVLQHAQQDEEANLYPKLQSSLDSQKNAALTALFAREFATVKPRRGT